MKCFFLPAAALFLSTLVMAQKNDIATLEKLNYSWLAAYPKRDTAVLSKILAEDFILVNPAGAKKTKKDNLDNMLDPNIETLSVSIDSVEVKMINPVTGLLTAWTSFTFKAGDKEMKGRNCYQDVYVKRKGRWMAIAAHVTSLGVQ